MITIYQLDLLINGKVVQFSMNADEELIVRNKIPHDLMDRWRTKLQAVAQCIFKENDGI